MSRRADPPFTFACAGLVGASLRATSRPAPTRLPTRRETQVKFGPMPTAQEQADLRCNVGSCSVSIGAPDVRAIRTLRCVSLSLMRGRQAAYIASEGAVCVSGRRTRSELGNATPPRLRACPDGGYAPGAAQRCVLAPSRRSARSVYMLAKDNSTAKTEPVVKFHG